MLCGNNAVLLVLTIFRFWLTCLHTIVGKSPDLSSEVYGFVAIITAQNWIMSCQKYTFVLPQTWLEIVMKSHQKSSFFFQLHC